MKSILYIASFVGVITYLFWDYMPEHFFYYGNALFIMLICCYIYLKDKRSFIAFFLFCASFNNLIDEVIGNATKLGFQELSLLVILPTIWYFKNRKNDREI